MVGDSSSSDLIWQMLAAVESAEMTAGLGSRASAAALSFMDPLNTSRRRAISLKATEEPDQAICEFTQEDGVGCLYMERVEGATDEKILEL